MTESVFLQVEPDLGIEDASVEGEESIQVLAERAQLTKQAAGELIDQMEAAGYVDRSADPTDARAKLIGFTDRGWRAVDTALGVFDDLEATLADAVGAERVATARQVLEVISQLLGDDSA